MILKNAIRAFMFITLNIIVAPSYGALSFSGLEAYKLELENHLDSKIRQAVNPLVSADSYSLSVSVAIKSSAEIAKIIPPTETQDLDADAEYQEDFNFVGSQPSAEETLLPLTKLGLWERKANITKKERMALKKKGESTPASSYFSYRDLVASISINMFVDEGLSDDLSLAVERIMRGALPTTEGPLNVVYKKIPVLKTTQEEKEKSKIEQEKAADPAKEKDEKEKSENKEKEKTLLDYLSEFKMPLAILIFTLALFVMGLIIMSNMNRLSLRKMNLIEKQAEREEAAFKAAQFREEEKTLKALNTQEPINDNELEKMRTEVRARLKMLFETQPLDLSQMIRRWVLFKGEGAEEGLNFCARNFSVTEISKIIDGLTDEERRSWNLALAKPFGSREEQAALRFLEGQILVHMISSVPRSVEDIKDLISQLSLSETLSILAKNQELGAIILFCLQSIQVAKVFESLDRDMVAKVSQLAVQVTPELIRSKAGELRTLVEHIKNDSVARSPFVDRLQTLLTEVSPEKETPLFLAMAGQVDRKVLMDMARHHFPSDLVQQIPPPIIKKAFNSMPLVKRAELVVSQDGEKKDFLAQLIGEGKAREVIDEEINSIATDEGRSRLLQKNAASMWKQFIFVARAQTRDEVQRGDLDDVIKPWVESLAQRGRSHARRAA